jgi:uncharacterized repeat protein (TIGR02543 family)
MGKFGYNLRVSTRKSTEDALKQVARIAILTTLILILPPTLTANASTTRVWEAVNVAGSGLDTLANNAQVTVSFGKAGRYDIGFGNSVGGAFYLTDGSCKPSSTPPCTESDIDGTVRFTFGSPQTHIQIHYAYIEANDPERVMSNLGPVDLRAESSGGKRVSSTGNLLSGQPAATNMTDTGLIYPTSGVASGTVELRFASPGVNFIEFQNDFPTESTYSASFGQNLVGLSLPVEYAQVTFDANSGAGTMSAQSAARATNISSNTFTYSGYTFAGWNTAADGSGSPFANNASFPFTADTVLYAQWTLTPVVTTTQATTAPAPTPLLATTGADNSRTILIAGTATLLAIAGLMIFGIRRQLREAE